MTVLFLYFFLTRNVCRCTEAVQLLKENGGDINREDVFGLNPLYLANNSVNGEETFRFLLSEGARFNQVSQEKMISEGKHIPEEARAPEEEMNKEKDGEEVKEEEPEKDTEAAPVAPEDDFVNV